MKNENKILWMNNSINDLGYTGVGDGTSNRKIFLTITLPNLVDEIENKTLDEFDLEGRGIQKINIPSNIFDIYTRLEILLGLERSGHSKTLKSIKRIRSFLRNA